MSQAFRTPRSSGISGGGVAGVGGVGGVGGGGVSVGGVSVEVVRSRAIPERAVTDCGTEPGGLTYRRARDILNLHEVHGPQCRQWLAAAAYLSAGLDDE